MGSADWTNWAMPLMPLVFLATLAGLIFTLSRLALVIWQFPRVQASQRLASVLLQGARVDSIQIGLMLLLPILSFPLAASELTWGLWLKLCYGWSLVTTVASLFLELVSVGFITEYDARPNRLFVEYLKYPKEVCSMLWRGFRLHVVVCFAAVIIATWWFAHLLQPILALQRTWPSWLILLMWPILFVLNALMIRSSRGHRPANPAMFALSNDAMVNSLILNSPWSVIHAIYSFKHENKSSERYGKMEAAVVLAKVQSASGIRFDQHPIYSTLHQTQPSRQRSKPLNLVIILEESLGATFVESLGGIGVCPELEKLKHQGWWFEQMYATGTRSVRGIEAVVSGFPPTPAQSVVKLSKSQRNFFTIASLLAAQGYHTEFIYGGESHFDNMNGFFRGNGFQSVIEQKDFVAPQFVGSWGVSDEDLFQQAHQRHCHFQQQQQPFFSLIFSSSNHAPFEFPEGRIRLHDSKAATENNAVKYADYALGQFFQQAQQSDYWDNTLFLVVADHDIRVRGEHLVPINNFHIPALILGADIRPKRIRRICSQIDLPVTLLSLMGIQAAHPMIGQDISQLDDAACEDPKQGRAMMQFNQNYAWMQAYQVAILQMGKAVVYADYDPIQKQLTINQQPDSQHQALGETALAHALLPSMLYQSQQYNIDLTFAHQLGQP